MDKERIVSILSKIPKEILIKCAEKLEIGIFAKTKNPLELELEKLTKSLTDPDLEDLESVMKRIREIKELLKHKASSRSKGPSFLIIPGAVYYDSLGVKYFSITLKDMFTPYELLGISEGAYLDTIKKAYREQIRLYHPDKGGTAEDFRQINEAYAKLSNNPGKSFPKQEYKRTIRQLHTILKNNTLAQLDLILIYLGIPSNTLNKNDLYVEDNFADDKDYMFTKEYKDLKNQKLIQIRDIVKARTASSSKSDCVSRSKVSLRDYQIKAIRFINDSTQKSLLVVHGTGTGKTLTALTASQCYLDANPNDKVLVISPASLTGNFAKEMGKYGGKLSSKYSFYSFTKFTSLNKGSYKTPFDMYYEDEIEAFRDLHPDDSSDEIRYMMSKHFNEDVRNSTAFNDYKKRANEINIRDLYNCNNTMLIIDEAHNMRNMGAAYEAVLKCVMQCKKLLLLTATPFVNNLHDFTPLINMIYRDENILKKGNRNKIPLKITSEDKYFKALETIYDHLRGKVTFLNEKTSEDFPTVKMHKKEIDMTPDFFEKYRKALVADRKFGDAPEVFYNGFRRAVNAVGAEEYLNQKLDIILKLVGEGRQTLVFTNWVEAGVEVLTQAFQEKDISYLVISGEVLANTRLEIVEKFNNKRVQVLIITLAGSEGLDLKEVRDVIILDPVWNPAVMEQIIGRAVRYRSHANLPLEERKVDVYSLILKTPPDAEVPSGDEILYAFIYEKRKQLNDVEKMLKNASI
jgi:SNF2 family DNA or RNA helicase